MGRLPQRMVDATGTRRRLQGLAVGGHATRQIGAAIGRSADWVVDLFRAEQVTAEVAQLVADATARLSRTPPPTSCYASNVRNKAARKGWWPLDAWFDIDTDPEPSTVDEITVMHAVAGYLRWDQLREQEQRLVVQELGGRGWSDVRIAEHLSTNHSRVARARNRLGVPAVPTIGRRTA